MKLTKTYAFAILAAAMTMVGCSDKENGKSDGPEDPGTGSGTMTEMTPSESKTFLTDVATEVMDYFNPADQKEAMEQAAYFLDRYGDYDMPEEFEIDDDDDDTYGAPAKFMRMMLSAANGDMDALTRMSYYYTYNINFDRFTGVYKPNSRNEEWVKTANSGNIEFIFDGNDGLQCSLVVTKSGNNSDINIKVTDEYYDDRWVDEYNISIPQNIKATFKAGSKILATTDVTSSINVSGHTLSLNATATLCNLKATTTVAGTDSNIAADMKFYANEKQLAYAYAKINGSNLCAKDKVQELIENEFEDPYFARMVSGGECKVDVIGKVQAYGNLTYRSGLFEDFDESWSNYEYDSKERAESDCKRVCDSLNSAIVVKLCYNNTTTQQATLKFVPLYDSYESYYYNWWEYYVGNQLLFADGTTYDVDNYFSKFTVVSNKFESIIDAYERVWENAL